MNVRVIRQDSPTNDRRWVTRRINYTLKSMVFASAVIPVTTMHAAYSSGVSVKVQPFPSGVTVFDCEFNEDWTDIGIQEFIRYMKNSKNVVGAFLTPNSSSGTIPPCTSPTDPQLATSAT